MVNVRRFFQRNKKAAAQPRPEKVLDFNFKNRTSFRLVVLAMDFHGNFQRKISINAQEIFTQFLSAFFIGKMRKFDSGQISAFDILLFIAEQEVSHLLCQ